MSLKYCERTSLQRQHSGLTEHTKKGLTALSLTPATYGRVVFSMGVCVYSAFGVEIICIDTVCCLNMGPAFVLTSLGEQNGVLSKWIF